MISSIVLSTELAANASCSNQLSMFRVNSLEVYFLRLMKSFEVPQRSGIRFTILTLLWIGSSSVSKHKIKVNNKCDTLRASCVQKLSGSATTQVLDPFLQSWSSFKARSVFLLLILNVGLPVELLEIRLQQRPRSKNQCEFLFHGIAALFQ